MGQGLMLTLTFRCSSCNDHYPVAELLKVTDYRFRVTCSKPRPASKLSWRLVMKYFLRYVHYVLVNCLGWLLKFIGNDHECKILYSKLLIQREFYRFEIWTNFSRKHDMISDGVITLRPSNQVPCNMCSYQFFMTSRYATNKLRRNMI